jgi:hypothetical protein
MKRAAIQSGIETIQLDSWDEFYPLVASDFANAPAYVFRGQADARWQAESSLDRWERSHSAAAGRPLPNAEDERPPGAVPRSVHLRAFRQAIRAISPVDLQREDDAVTWAVAQHHGLRTPLLDWSLSPFVALYFAFEDERVADGDQLVEPEHRAVLALSTSAISRGSRKAAGDEGLFPRVYSPGGPVSRRLLAQSSLFLMMPAGADLEAFVAEHFAAAPIAGPAQPVLKKIQIPSAGRRECLKMLNKMNINRLTLFPDLDGAARYINSLWDLDFNSSLGYFEDFERAENAAAAQ